MKTFYSWTSQQRSKSEDIIDEKDTIKVPLKPNRHTRKEGIIRLGFCQTVFSTQVEVEIILNRVDDTTEDIGGVRCHFFFKQALKEEFQDMLNERNEASLVLFFITKYARAFSEHHTPSKNK